MARKAAEMRALFLSESLSDNRLEAPRKTGLPPSGQVSRYSEKSELLKSTGTAIVSASGCFGSETQPLKKNREERSTSKQKLYFFIMINLRVIIAGTNPDGNKSEKKRSFLLYRNDLFLV